MTTGPKSHVKGCNCEQCKGQKKSYKAARKQANKKIRTQCKNLQRKDLNDLNDLTSNPDGAGFGWPG